jgi:hypothetical protein
MVSEDLHTLGLSRINHNLQRCVLVVIFASKINFLITQEPSQRWFLNTAYVRCTRSLSVSSIVAL